MSKSKYRKVSNTARLSDGRICDQVTIDKNRVDELLYESDRTITEWEHIFLEDCARRLGFERELTDGQREKLDEVENRR